MAIKILRNGKDDNTNHIHTIECSGCNSLLEYKKEDTTAISGNSNGVFRYELFVECPVCRSMMEHSKSKVLDINN